MGKRLTQDQLEQIYKLVDEGYKIREIAEKMGVSRGIVGKYRVKHLYPNDERPHVETTEEWLRRCWRFEVKEPIRIKDGYRVVYKGDKAKLRTPTRTDGRFH